MSERSNFQKGLLMGLPIAVGFTAIGVPFGILANKAGIPLWAVALMCVVVLAGSAQFIAVQLISVGTGFWPIVAATFVINLRHFLMTTSLGGSLKYLNLPSLFYIAHTTTDETYGINIGKISGDEKLETASVFGTNIVAHLSWTVASVFGAWLGDFIPVNLEYLAGALPVMFAVLLGLQLKKIEHFILVIVTVLLTVLFIHLIPGQWPFLITVLIVPTLATVFFKD